MLATDARANLTAAERLLRDGVELDAIVIDVNPHVAAALREFELNFGVPFASVYLVEGAGRLALRPDGFAAEDDAALAEGMSEQADVIGDE